ncbi:MAG: glycoside hydrolase family 5 protein, partial [Cytophagaceae bacterium]
MKKLIPGQRFYLSLFCQLFLLNTVFSQASHYGVNLAGLEFGSPPGTYNSTYFKPSAAELDYYNSKGLKLVRLPFLWERVQPTLGGPLDAAYLGYIDNVVSDAKARGMSVILDVHNYGRYNGNLIGSASVSISNFKDLWARLAQHYASETAVWAFDLMNEPHDMTTAWNTIAQAAIDTIRIHDNSHFILVEGDNWAKGDTWVTYNDILKNLSDPAHKIIYEAHIYFDSNGSGTYASTSFSTNGATVNTGVTKITPFVNWLNTNNLRGIVGEYGVPNNASASDQSSWNTLLDNFMTYLKANCVGGTVWAGGPAWGSYTLSVEPTSGFTVDQPPMSVLQNYTVLPASCAFATCPKPALGSDRSTCTGASFPFAINTNTSLQSNVTYTWKRISPSSTVLVNASSTANTLSITAGDGFGTYVVLRDTFGLCVNSDTIIISNSVSKPDLGSSSLN